MIKEFFPSLSETNPHPRDKHIKLDYDTHIYTIEGYDPGVFKSVTAWKEEKFPDFEADEIIARIQLRTDFGESRYTGMSSSEIKNLWDSKRTECADLGRWLHRDIEGFLNDNSLVPGYSNGDLFRIHKIAWFEETNEHSSEEIGETEEWLHFMRFVRDYADLIPYRTEWMVYHETYKIVGTIDCVYKFVDKNGETKFAIFDWKRSEKKLDKTKHFDGKFKDKRLSFMKNNSYWQYAVQLNLYRIILMDKYGISTDHMYILRLHPKSSNYQLVRMPILDWVLRPMLEN